MPDSCIAFVILVSELANIGDGLGVKSPIATTKGLAYDTALAVLHRLPAVGRVYVRDGLIDNKTCFVFKMGKLNTPFERVSAKLLGALTTELGKQLRTFFRYEKRGDWSDEGQALILGPTVFTWRRGVATDHI
ncbi:hypothetical protein BDV93DRAFT_561468 [Ceratobasidium sp. AG-I]|nr:hypothetical protein BDV93DRAFT_561468 [Ceratobasidium sp. AG-I]